jgi:hypothetical protein
MRMIYTASTTKTTSDELQQPYVTQKGLTNGFSGAAGGSHLKHTG